MVRSTTARVRNQRIVVSKRGGPDVLEVVEEDLPRPAAGEVRVKVLAAGVSGFDVMVRSRSFPGFPRLPFTPGEDVVGRVDEVGKDVTTIHVGDRVAGWTFGDGGGYAEYVCRPARELVPVPAAVDAVDAAAVVVNYLTAHLALHQTAAARSGERVLIQGAAGGVGTALLHLGGLAGLELYGTASAHNDALVKALGATPIDYRSENVVERVRRLTGDGVDVVVDLVGGPRQLWQSYRTLRKGGRLVMLGMAGTVNGGAKIIPPSLLVIAMVKVLPDGRSAP